MYIKKEEFNEFQEYKKWKRKRKIREAVERVEFLEDDIDAPIRNCVAMTALLGASPIFSCCGFDYADQPEHKSHQYGNPYIKFRLTENSLNLCLLIHNSLPFWRIKIEDVGTIDLEVIVKGNPHWRNDECIHFSEECVIVIGRLEKLLWGLEKNMSEGVVLCDTNDASRKGNKYWQYPPKKEWEIKKYEIEKLMKSD